MPFREITDSPQSSSSSSFREIQLEPKKKSLVERTPIIREALPSFRRRSETLKRRLSDQRGLLESQGATPFETEKAIGQEAAIGDIGVGAGVAVDVIGGEFNRLLKFVDQKLLSGAGSEAIGNFLQTKKGKSFANTIKNIVEMPKELVSGREAEEWEQFAKENPVAAQRLEAALPVAELGAEFVGVGTLKRGAKPAIKAAKEAAEGVGELAQPTLKAVGESLEQSAKKSIRKEAESIVSERLEDLTKKERLAQRKNVEEGFLGQRTLKNTDTEAVDMATELVEQGKLKSSQTTVKQLEVLDDAIGEEALGLIKKLDEAKEVYDKAELRTFVDDAAAGLKESPTIVGDAEKSAQKILKGFNSILDKTGDNMSDLLQARKDFDTWLKMNGINLDKLSDLGKANNLAVKKMRNTINDFIDQKSQIDVKDSLKRQRALYRNRDVIENRFSREPAGIIGRGLQKVQQIAGIPKSEIIETLGLIGLGVGATASIGAPIAIGALTGIAAKRLLSKIPRLKLKIAEKLKGKQLEEAMKVMDEIESTTKEISQSVKPVPTEKPSKPIQSQQSSIEKSVPSNATVSKVDDLVKKGVIKADEKELAEEALKFDSVDEFINSNQNAIGEKLYLANKEAKKIRDEVQALKKELFEEDPKYAREPFSGDWFSSEKELDDWMSNFTDVDDIISSEELKTIDDIIEFDGSLSVEDAKNILDGEYAKYDAETGNWYSKKEWDDYMDQIDESIDEVSEMHEKIKHGSDYRNKANEIYELKDRIIEKIGADPVEIHRFKDDEYNVYPMYKIGDFSFHRKVEIDDWIEQSGKDINIDDLKSLDSISSKSKVEKEFKEEDIEFLMNIEIKTKSQLTDLYNKVHGKN